MPATYGEQPCFLLASRPGAQDAQRPSTGSSASVPLYRRGSYHRRNATREGSREMESDVDDKDETAVDEVVWGHLVRMIRAAHSLSHSDYMDRVNELGLEGKWRQQRAWLCVRFLLRAAVGDFVEWRVPDDEDLKRISRENVDGFRALVGGDEQVLENLLRRAWERPIQTKFSLGKFVVMGAAAIGILYRDPEESLRKMRPHLQKWWSDFSGDFYRKGLLPLPED